MIPILFVCDLYVMFADCDFNEDSDFMYDEFGVHASDFVCEDSDFMLLSLRWMRVISVSCS